MWTSPEKRVVEEFEASARVWLVQSRRCHWSVRPVAGRGGDTTRRWCSFGVSTRVVSEEMDGVRGLGGFGAEKGETGQEKALTKVLHVGQGVAMGLERTRTLCLDILTADLQINVF